MEEKRCRRCRAEIEDDQHILSACIINNKLIQERHNQIVKKIDKELKKNFPQNKVQIECIWRSGTDLVKSDITMIDETRSHCTIIEITCPYETNKEYLRQRKMKRKESIAP